MANAPCLAEQKKNHTKTTQKVVSRLLLPVQCLVTRKLSRAAGIFIDRMELAFSAFRGALSIHTVAVKAQLRKSAFLTQGWHG